MLIHPEPLEPLARRLRSGEQELEALVRETCDRIEAVEPQIHALLPEPGRRARLLREAAALRARFPEPERRPPLYGVLVGVKDIYHVEGFPTRAGSELPPELFAGPQASAVTRLRAAGALILGKTVTTEFAFLEPGPTRNPWAPAHTPGGSSSGSAAAVAAGFCPLALGTQTVGSVIRPASFCGVVGFKPTYGRVPLDGVIPFSASADHPGLLTADAAGMTLAASIVCPDWKKPVSARTARPVLGIPDGPYLEQVSTRGLETFREQMTLLERCGYEVRRVPALAETEAINRRHLRLIAAEMAQVHRAWFAEHAERYRPRTAATIREGQEVGEAELEAARAGRGALRAELERLMDEHGLDLWVCPAAAGPAPEGIGATGDGRIQLPWTHAGMPVVTLPLGRVGELPLGLQFIARAGRDEQLLAWAEQLQPTAAGARGDRWPSE